MTEEEALAESVHMPLVNYFQKGGKTDLAMVVALDAILRAANDQGLNSRDGELAIYAALKLRLGL